MSVTFEMDNAALDRKSLSDGYMALRSEGKYSLAAEVLVTWFRASFERTIDTPSSFSAGWLAGVAEFCRSMLMDAQAIDGVSSEALLNELDQMDQYFEQIQSSSDNPFSETLSGDAWLLNVAYPLLYAPPGRPVLFVDGVPWTSGPGVMNIAYSAQDRLAAAVSQKDAAEARVLYAQAFRNAFDVFQSTSDKYRNRFAGQTASAEGTPESEDVKDKSAVEETGFLDKVIKDLERVANETYEFVTEKYDETKGASGFVIAGLFVAGLAAGFIVHKRKSR